ncbi:hypothetical protein EHYA_00868 [Embleya hyalina]|uniref:Uncharacterized protein n=1 Tax=Embleya hyalina TaxID=516124 RepID=A0A401YF46_9ACTN|nr:hypothetical protein EHYA_00868 [Embleya hyalina]
MSAPSPAVTCPTCRWKLDPPQGTAGRPGKHRTERCRISTANERCRAGRRARRSRVTDEPTPADGLPTLAGSVVDAHRRGRTSPQLVHLYGQLRREARRLADGVAGPRTSTPDTAAPPSGPAPVPRVPTDLGVVPAQPPDTCAAVAPAVSAPRSADASRRCRASCTAAVVPGRATSPASRVWGGARRGGPGRQPPPALDDDRGRCRGTRARSSQVALAMGPVTPGGPDTPATASLRPTPWPATRAACGSPSNVAPLPRFAHHPPGRHRSRPGAHLGSRPAPSPGPHSRLGRRPRMDPPPPERRRLRRPDDPPGGRIPEPGLARNPLVSREDPTPAP